MPYDEAISVSGSDSVESGKDEEEKVEDKKQPETKVQPKMPAAPKKIVPGMALLFRKIS